MQLAKLLTVQGAYDDMDLASLLTEVTFLLQVPDVVQATPQSHVAKEEDLLVNSTALQLALHLDLRRVAEELLREAGNVLNFVSGPRSRPRTLLYPSCRKGDAAMVELLLNCGVNAPTVDGIRDLGSV